MKRVLFFRPSMAEGGADRVTLTVLRLLDRARFAPSLALMRQEGPFLADLPADVEVHAVRAPRLALAAPSLAMLLRQLQPDVLLSTSSTGNIVAAMAHLAARSRARLVLSERTPLFRGGERSLKHHAFALAKRASYGRADLITAVAGGIADQLTGALRLPMEKVRVLDNPMIDDELPRAAAAPLVHPFFDGRVPVVLACGRMVPIKEYPVLLRAFAAIRKQRDARLVILGDGPVRPAMEELAAELGLGDDVWFAGFDKNPFRYMARAALLLHASRAEGMPGAQIQAMACGIPVVSTDCEFGPREVIRNGENGYLVPVGDVAALARRALELLGDEPLRRRLGEQARRSVTRFSAAAAMRGYEAALDGGEPRGERGGERGGERSGERGGGGSDHLAAGTP